MLSIKRRKYINFVLSMVLLLSVIVPFGNTYAAAKTGNGSRIVKISAGFGYSMALKADGTVIAWGDNEYGQTNVPSDLRDVVAIAAGETHAIALKSDGTVVAWGDNRVGAANIPTGLNNVVSIAAGIQHSIALKSDGTVVSWGSYIIGETDVLSGLRDVVAIAGHGWHWLALKSDGTVAAWGDNERGQTTIPDQLKGVISISAGLYNSFALKSDGTAVAWGDNSQGQSTIPNDLNGIISISAGDFHTLALKSDGTVVAWGYGANGQTTVPSQLKGVVAIEAGAYHSLALKMDGTVVAWGHGINGQTNVPPGLDSPIKATKIAAGAYNSLALKSDGTVVAWGNNDMKQLNIPKNLNGVIALATGYCHSLALKSDGTVVAWGDNGKGQLKVPSNLKGVVAIAAGLYYSLALKSDGTVVAWGENRYGESTVPPNLNDVVAIAAGSYHSLALKSDGTVVAWGENVYGESTVPKDLSGVVAISGGDVHSLALKSDGTVVAWGLSGLGATTVPKDLSGVVSIVAGYDHSLALKSDGTVVAWGYNSEGQSTVPNNLNGVIAIAAGWVHSLALKSDGTVVAWGSNEYGQTTVPVGNDNLKGLTLQEGPFDKSFSSSDLSYTYSYIGPSVSSVHVTATLADTAYTALYVNGQKQISGSNATVAASGDSTVIPIRVEPYFKAGKTYTITVLRDSTPPHIVFETDGNTFPARIAASKVTVTDTESGLDDASLQYVWAPSTSVPSVGWQNLKSGDTLTQTGGDGNWYLHIRAADRVGNIAEVVSNAFVLDNTPPTVALSSTASGTANAAFPVTITFSEPVTGFSKEGIHVNNATISDFVAVDAMTYTAAITPTTSGQTVTVQVASDEATDVVGHGNEASDVWSIMYDTTKPVVTFGFTDNQIFHAPPTTVHLSVSEAVYGIADGLEMDNTDVAKLMSMEKDGQPFTDYTVIYDNAAHMITLTFSHILGDGTYKVLVAGDVIQNAIHNTLDAASVRFTVAVPDVTGISANPTSLVNTGGSTSVTITGSNLMGQSLKVYVDGAESCNSDCQQ